MLGEASIDEFSVNDKFEYQLYGQAFQTFSLVRLPVVAVVNTVHGLSLALLKGLQGFA